MEPSKSEIVRRGGRSRRSGKAEPPQERREEERFSAGAKAQNELSRKGIEHLIHELEVHRFELEMQNQELRLAQLELERSRNKYVELYDFAPVGYFTFDEYGVVLDLNLTGASQLGMERKNLLRKPFSLYVAPESKSAFRAHMRAVLARKERRSCEIQLIRTGNQEASFFFAQLDSVYTPELNGAGQCRTAIIDMTERRSAEETLRAANETLQALIHAAPLAIYTIDRDGRVRTWNRAAERIFGWRREEAIGELLPSVPDERLEEFARMRERVLLGEILTAFETVRRRKDGALIQVNLSTALLYNMDGSARGLMVIAEDITERKRSEAAVIEMNRALQEKNSQVEAASQARKKFFSYISHELKTPLNSIIGFTQLLRNESYGALSAQQTRALGLIYKNGGELLRLINNILDLARIESGKMPNQLIETDLRELMERVCIMMEPLVQQKELRLERKASRSFPERFLTDPNKIKSILGNLLSNAIRFTEKGEIQVDLQPLSGRPGIALTVSDSGIGIKPADLEKIFDEYEQTSNAEDGSGEYTKGSGLGLAIVKKMVVALNGEIEVKSRPGSGTTFTIKIPQPASL
ncbi:MAG TPA: PAS domain-containing sensor histidine kinase [Candidatus Manganitrophaceae bacterium]|nr:PAS domain-containing sensor histidine kinase [Candidatus Manganitrophaceae bacterium]